MKPVKNLLGYAFALLITLVMLELGGRLLFDRMTGQPYDRAVLAKQHASRVTELDRLLDPPQEAAKAFYQFHPYTGYAGTPSAHPWGGEGPPINSYGMLSVAGHPYPYKKRSDELVIAVLGGSVAEIFANKGEKYVQRFAREDLGYDRPIVLLNLAIGGYKQPQQLFLLQYALLSGFQIDAVLNIDGFNELALGQHNLDSGVNPLFPSAHHLGQMSKLGGSLDRRAALAMAEYYSLLDREATTLRLLQQAPFRQSAFLTLAGEIWAQRTRAAAGQVQYRLAEDSRKSLGTTFKGPPFPEADTETLIRLWQDASRLLNVVAKGRDLTYVHVLQPNQYLADSKPLTEHEKQVAYNPDNVWGQTIRRAYAQMRDAGSELREEGVAFFDLTGIFAGNTEDIYIDDCCHFDERGNEILAQHAIRLVLQEHRSQTSATATSSTADL